jgi:flagellar motor switch protein FliM
MNKTPSQVEIDALLTASRSPSGKEPKARSSAEVTRCNFREAGQISKEQVRSVSALHDAFAVHLTNSLGPYLRVAMEVSLVSVEQVTFSEFVARLPYDLTYLASVNIVPLDAVALFQMDLSLAFPVIDLVLGGLGKDAPEERAITEIEEHILENVMHIICRELQSTWNTVFNAQFRFARREVTQQVSGLMLASEKVLALGFEIRMPDATGLLSVAFPAVVSNTLLRKLAAQWSQSKQSSPAHNSDRLRERLQGTRFAVELSLPETPVPLQELVAIEAGSVLVLKHRVTEPIRLAVSGKDMFLATPVSCGRQRGAQVTGAIPLAVNNHKE